MWEKLTPRERMVAECIAQGQTPQETCLNLNITPSTYRNHVMYLRRKLGVHSRTQIAVWMWRNGRVQ